MNREYGKICSKMQKTRKRGFSMMIRKAERRDREEYIRMAHEFYHSPAVLHPIPDAYFERTFDEYLRNDTYVGCYILEYEGNYAGYGLTARTFSQEAGGYVYWLEELYVREAYRSKGFGSAFFQYMEEHREEGVTRFRLEVEDDNVRASALYKRLGYEYLEYRQMIKEFED